MYDDIYTCDKRIFRQRFFLYTGREYFPTLYNKEVIEQDIC